MTAAIEDLARAIATYVQAEGEVSLAELAQVFLDLVDEDEILEDDASSIWTYMTQPGAAALLLALANHWIYLKPCGGDDNLDGYSVQPENPGLTSPEQERVMHACLSLEFVRSWSISDANWTSRQH